MTIITTIINAIAGFFVGIPMFIIGTGLIIGAIGLVASIIFGVWFLKK